MEQNQFKLHCSKFVDYGNQKISMSFVTKLLFSILGGGFIAIGFIAFILCKGQLGTYGALLGSLLFPVGLLMCIYLGGNLFTSNCILISSVVAKDSSIGKYTIDLLITLLGNLIGGFLVALIAWGAGVFRSTVNYEALMGVANSKMSATAGHDWWNNIFSGIMCNVLVAGSVLVYINVDNKVVSTFVIYLMLVVFVFCGFQHVVANLFLYSEAMLVQTNHEQMWNATNYGEVFYINLLPTLVGNFIGGVAITMGCMSTTLLKHKNHDREESNKEGLKN